MKSRLRLSGCKGRIFITILLLCQLAVFGSPWEKKCNSIRVMWTLLD